MEYSFNVKKIKVEEHVFFVIESNILKGCVAQSDTLDDALALFSELEREWLETAKKYDIPIPTEATDVQPKATCRMIPLEPDCRGYTDVFICTHCHQHIHLGFIRKEYSGNFCIECGAECKEAD